MRIELMNIFPIMLSTIALFISLYQLWDSKRKKLKIYLGTSIDNKDDMIIHFIKFDIINKSNRPLHIFDTKFYLYPKAPVVLWYNLFNRIKHNGIREYFGSIQGHLYNESPLIDIPYQIRLEAYEVYSYYSKLKKEVKAIKIELIDMDGKKYHKKVYLNQLEHDQNNRLSPKEYCFPKRFYKHEDKIRKQKIKNKRLENRINSVFS